MSLKYPEIDPVALAVGPLQIRWYALAYLAGFLLGWVYALRLAGLKNREDNVPLGKNDIDDFLSWAVLGVILGGRIGYILFYQLGSYWENPAEILRVWHGGMSFHGGAAGVILAMLLFAWKRRLPVLDLADIVCCCVPIGLFFGRIANFINGELFGRPGSVPWTFVFPQGGPEPRHPSQLYEAGLEGLILGLLLFGLAHVKFFREKPGVLSGVFLTGYAVSRIIVEFFREPDPQLGFILGVATMGQLLCAPMILGGLYLLARPRLLKKS